jgi:hypothetical protein
MNAQRILFTLRRRPRHFFFHGKIFRNFGRAGWTGGSSFANAEELKKDDWH